MYGLALRLPGFSTDTGIDKARLCGHRGSSKHSHFMSDSGARLVCQNNLRCKTAISLSITGRFRQLSRQSGLHRCGVKGGLVEVDALYLAAAESFYNVEGKGPALLCKGRRVNHRLGLALPAKRRKSRLKAASGRALHEVSLATRR